MKGSSINSSERHDDDEVLFPTVRPTTTHDTVGLGGFNNGFTVTLKPNDDDDEGLYIGHEEGELYHNDSIHISYNILSLLFSAVLSLPYLI